MDGSELWGTGACPDTQHQLSGLFVDQRGDQHVLCLGYRAGDTRTWMTHGVVEGPETIAWDEAFSVAPTFLNPGDNTLLFGMLANRVVLATGRGQTWLQGWKASKPIGGIPYSLHVTADALVAIHRDELFELSQYWKTSIFLRGPLRTERLPTTLVDTTPTLWRLANAVPSELEPPVFWSASDGRAQLALPVPLPPAVEVPESQAVLLAFDHAIPLGGFRVRGAGAALIEREDELLLRCRASRPPVVITHDFHLYSRAVCDDRECTVVYLEPVQPSFPTGSMRDPTLHVKRLGREHCL